MLGGKVSVEWRRVSYNTEALCKRRDAEWQNQPSGVDAGEVTMQCGGLGRRRPLICGFPEADLSVLMESFG